MPVYTYCDEDSLHAESTKVSSLTPNQFHKLCPGTHVAFGSSDNGSSSTKYSDFGQPRCGDGTNFSFFVSKPLKQLANDRKILIEFQGGGACWDGDTCEMQQEMLAYPEMYDSFVGMSCSEIEYGAAVQGGNPLSMLCAKKVGKTDFREYNTIVVPYCTQDVHIGDAPNVSYDGNNVVHHVGAHNMIRTLNWVFQNFPNPSHIFLTGCSAGGTAVPIAYDIVNKHYNTFLKGGPRAVNINLIMDSSVYLTPSYFLKSGLPNWNPGTIMKKKIQFNYNKYKYYDNYPDLVWNHVLRRGSNNHRWGFVTHSTDPVSLMFYQYMSGGDGGYEGRSLSLASPHDTTSAEDHGRRMDSNGNSQWWTEISSSMNFVQKRHHNVDLYVIDGEGHCSFGLYYPLQEDGFEEWATPIMKEKMVFGNAGPSFAPFLTSVAFGGVLIFLTQRKTKLDNKGSLMKSDNDDSSYMGETVATRVRLGFCMEKAQNAARPIVTKCQSWPWTAGYLFATTIYFISMLISQGFAHPLDNPGFGPSAVGLSTFGINNPALIIYRMQHVRLITSSFLCSGVTTYLFMSFTMYKTGLEAAMQESNHPHWHFLLAAGILSFAINLVYACVGNGASSSSLALALGLNAFSVTLRRSSISYPSPLCFTVVVFILVSTPLFPFDSVAAFLTAITAGVIIGLALFVQEPVAETESGDVYHNEVIVSESPTEKLSHRIRWKFVSGISAVYLVMYLLLLFRLPSPDQNNVHPYLTGCSLVYSDQIGDFVNSYTNSGRDLEEGNGDDWFDSDNICAQMCLPHLVYRPALWGAHQFASIALETGTCEKSGYESHIADKTFNEYSVVFEVQLFTASNGDK